MQLLIRKWGNSAAVLLPAALLDQLNVALGDKLVVDIRPEGIMLLPKRPRYALPDLIAQCDLNAPPPADISLWDEMRAVGREAL